MSCVLIQRRCLLCQSKMVYSDSSKNYRSNIFFKTVNCKLLKSIVKKLTGWLLYINWTACSMKNIPNVSDLVHTEGPGVCLRIFKCRVRLLCRAVLYKQCSHWKGFASEWVNMWLSRCSFRAAWYEHSEQAYGLTPVCFLMCRRRWDEHEAL